MNQGLPGSTKHPAASAELRRAGPKPAGRRPVWRGIKITLGVILIPLGVVGLFLPFLQGVLFLFIGLALLSSEVPFVARLRDRIRRRHPGPWEKAEKLGDRFRAWFRGKGAAR